MNLACGRTGQSAQFQIEKERQEGTAVIPEVARFV
jgi:hypothetical protein